MSEEKLLIRNSSGLSFEFLRNGSVRSIEVAPIRISLKPATSFSGSGTNIFLRKRGHPVLYKALLGPESDSQFRVMEEGYFAAGRWNGLDYTCFLQLSPRSTHWQWNIRITNQSAETDEMDLLYVQDIGLKQISDGLVNEYYVSQYLERIILEDQNFGSVICCRQNIKEPTGHPWLMLTCKNGALSAATDGMQVYGKSYRETGIPEGLVADWLGGDCAGESPIVALQEKPFRLAPGENHQTAFVGCALVHHPAATSEEDLKRLPELFREFPEVTPTLPAEGLSPAPKNLFNTAPFLPVNDLDDQELLLFFGKERRHAEVSEGRLLSFFCREHDHVVLRTKESLVDRPHGHIMQAKAGYAPDENIVSTTSYAFGVFNSHLTQGNTNFDTLLSVCTTQFNQSPESGQRIFLELNGLHYLLGVPSAFEMGLNHCRWIYKSGNHCFQVRTWTSKEAPQVNMEFKVLSGEKVRLLVTHDFDRLNGWSVFHGKENNEWIAKPLPGSMITGEFPDARFRIKVQHNDSECKASGSENLFPGQKVLAESLFVLDTGMTGSFCMSFIGEVCTAAREVIIQDADRQFADDCTEARKGWLELSRGLSLTGGGKDMEAIGEILPWYGLNALIHYLTPYGLEQYGGAAWGTRDVSQGPVDLLLTMCKTAEARKVLCIIFSNQNPDGGWPQWWMFDSYAHIRAGDSHGDIFYWVIIALSDYIRITGDLGILDERLPYFPGNGASGEEKTPVSEHIDRLIAIITGSFLPGTALVPFGGGDWNDSLQPVSKDLAHRLISSWTVEMNYQAFRQYEQVYRQAGNLAKAEELGEICDKIRSDFNSYLVSDGIVAGYGLLEDNGTISVLLHPSDKKTGISYSILPMERGIISGIFTREQTDFHQKLIEQHLKGPDGARLMNRPLKYKGGIQEIFRRAESSTFFGREIGLMYMHEHIRYAESLALTGKADEFLKALRQAIPVGYRKVVTCGDFRQSNCYYSSSDVTFRNRYEADERYDEIKTGKITLKGGWRVYSSGPGIFVSLVVSKLLGLRTEAGKVILDPVMPNALDGMTASLNFMGHYITLQYAVKEGTFSPESITVNGKAISFSHEENKYRDGGAVIPADQFFALLNEKDNLVNIRL